MNFFLFINSVNLKYKSFVSLQLQGHVFEHHFVELRHALDLDQASFVHVEVVPQVVEVVVYVLLVFGSTQFFVLGHEFFGDGQGSLLIHPVLSQLWLVLPTALAVAPALSGALILVFALGLQIEAAAAVASTVRIVRALHVLALKDQSITIQNQSVHEFVILIGQVPDGDHR